MVAQFTAKLNNPRWISIKKFAAPLAAAIVLLGLLNYGLYGRLAPKATFVPYQYPYQQDFSTTDIQSWIKFGGNWLINNGQLTQDKTSLDSASIYIPFSVSEKDGYTAQILLGLKETGGSLSFNAQYPGLEQNRHTVQLIPRDSQWQMVYGYFQKGSQIYEQGAIPLGIKADQPLNAKLTVAITNDRYALTLDDKLLVSNVPLVYKGGLMGLNSLDGAAQFDEFSVTQISSLASVPTPQSALQPTPITVVDDNVVIYTSQFAGNLEDSGWKPFSGDWTFENGKLIQRQLDGYDFGIVNDQTFQNYQVEVNFRHQQGNSAGMLFNLPQRESKNGGQLVRYTDDGKGLFWGYFDAQGAFTGQGYINTAPPAQDSHVLTVQSLPDTYSIILDGNTVAQDIPLNSRQGFIGLTTSQSVGEFASVSISNLGSSTAIGTKPIDLLANSQTVNGQWEYNPDGIQQTETEAADYVTGIGVLAEQYVIESDITLPTEITDAGGGVIFHMPARDTLAGAYMLRFGNGGKILFWGRYDDKGVFIGQGSVDVNLEPGEPHHLAVVVKTNSFDIQVDNKTIVPDVPLEQKSGWLGLISFRGPVIFSHLRMTLGASQP